MMISTKIRLFIFAGTTMLFAACSVTHESQCIAWRDQGALFATIDSCKECIDVLGASSVQSIQGCALGLDSAKVFEK